MQREMSQRIIRVGYCSKDGRLFPMQSSTQAQMSDGAEAAINQEDDDEEEARDSPVGEA